LPAQLNLIELKQNVINRFMQAAQSDADEVFGLKAEFCSIALLHSRTFGSVEATNVRRNDVAQSF
jgi:hypothetical protein